MARRKRHMVFTDPMVGTEPDAAASFVGGPQETKGRGHEIRTDDSPAATFIPACSSKASDAVQRAEIEAGHSAAESSAVKTRRRRWGMVPVAGAVAALVVGLGSGGAFAYFASQGSGTGHATTSTLGGVSVAALTPGDSPTSKLVPGGSADVILRVNNTNAFPVTLVSVSGGPAAITVSGGSGCTLANSGVAFVNQSGLTSTIGASGTTLIDLSGAATMTTSSFTGCQNATFNIPVSIAVQK